MASFLQGYFCVSLPALVHCVLEVFSPRTPVSLPSCPHPVIPTRPFDTIIVFGSQYVFTDLLQLQFTQKRFGITETYIIYFLMVAVENRKGISPSPFPAVTWVTAFEGLPLWADAGWDCDGLTLPSVYTSTAFHALLLFVFFWWMIN